MIVTSRSYHIAHLENNFSHSPRKLSSNIIFKIHLKSVVFNILVNLVVFLNYPRSTRYSVWPNFPPCLCTSWSSFLRPGRRLWLQQAAAPSPLPASPSPWLCGRVLSPGSGSLVWAGLVGEPSTEQGWNRSWGQSWEGWKLLLLVEIP